MSDLWRNSVVGKPYFSDKARRFFLQAPLCLPNISSPESGSAQTFVCEESCKELYSVVYASVEESRGKEDINHQQLLKDLCSIAGSGAEKELLKYTPAAMTNGSKRNVQKNLGISMGRKDSRRKNVHAAIEANKINEKMSFLKQVISSICLQMRASS